jgi:predicted dehydrogenase
MKTGVGIYGKNGHQIAGLLAQHPRAELVATAAYPADLPAAFLPLQKGEIQRGSAGLRENKNIRQYASLQELLRDERVVLVSLCSPRRRDQAADAIACLQSGKHVYAEKPCAMSEADLDGILDAAKSAGREFHEMAGTAFEQPYLALRRLVQAGTLGTVVQVLAQKSYPLHDRRPQDEDVDGGLLCQAGIHAIRFIEHVACQRIKDITALETGLGNPKSGNLKMAASYLARLENGGLASVIANYLNPPGFGQWGNEALRIFGTLGFVEAVDGGQRTRLVIKDKDLGPVDTTEPPKSYFDCFLDAIQGHGAMPLTLEEELHPTRIVIRAKQSAAG